MLTQAQYDALSEDIARAIDGPLKAAVDAQRETVVADLGVVARFVAIRLWPSILAMTPILARVALSSILARFAATTIAEAMDLIYAHENQTQPRTLDQSAEDQRP